MINYSLPSLADLSLSNSGLLYKLLRKLGLGGSTSKSHFVRYSALVQKHHRDFDQKMLNTGFRESPTGDPIISSMADINSSFETVIKMRIFPFDTKIMASTFVIMALPVLPLLAFEYKLADVLKKLAGLLF